MLAAQIESMGIATKNLVLFQLLPKTNMVSAAIKATRLIEKYVGCEKRLSNKWIGVPKISTAKKIVGAEYSPFTSMNGRASLKLSSPHALNNHRQLQNSIDVEIDETIAANGYLRKSIELI